MKLKWPASLPLLLPILAGALAPSAAAQSPAPLPDPPAARIAVVGASMSAGFDLLRTYRVQIDLTHILKAALRDEALEVHSLANTFLFSDPLRLGARQLEDARELAPRLVLALDFPFWFGYGDGLSEEGRLERLEQGLKWLEGLGVPVVVGDFPDMRAATKIVSAYGFPMLRASQVPAAATLERLNARMREWVGEERSRVLVSLDEFHRALSAGGCVEVRANRWTGEDLDRLLLEDQLHPSVEGNIALVLLALDALVKAEVGFAEADVIWDAQAVRERLDEATRAEREKAIERDRRREERQRAREQQDREQQDREQGLRLDAPLAVPAPGLASAA